MAAGRPKTAISLKEYFSTGLGKKKWKEGLEKSRSTSFGQYADGVYTAKLIKSAVTNAKTSGRLQHVFGFKFTEGDYKGQSAYQYQGVDNEVGISMLIQDLKKLGHDVEDPEDIEDVIDKKLEKEQPVVKIKLKTNGEYQNLSIVAGDVETEEEDEDAVDDEDTEKEADDEPADEDDSKSDKDSDEDDDKEAADEDEEDDDKDSEKEDEETPKKKKVVDEDEDDEEGEDGDTEVARSKKSKPSDEDDDEEKEEKEKPEEVELKPGMKLKVKYDGDQVKATIVKILEETSQLKVQLKNGEKIKIDVPDDVVEIL